MKVLGRTVRGGFKKVSVETTKSIIMINSPGGSNLSDMHGVFVQGCTSVRSEKTGIIQCFNDTNHVYAFGHDPEGSSYTCTLIVFMNADCEEFKSTGNLGEIITEYENMRVSKSKALVNMQIDTGKVLHGILVGMAVRVEDPELNMFAVTLTFKDTTGV